jgi:CMP/dCMP kinase
MQNDRAVTSPGKSWADSPARPRLIIAVDGPAAAGKGTLARALAAALDLPYLDTGLLYRAVARRMLDVGLDPSDDAEPAARALQASDMERQDLRTPEVDRAASQVAGQRPVRAALLDFQRQFGAEQGAVLDGRDIGTVIFPEAQVKLFLTASIPRRAERRWLQNGGEMPVDPRKRAEILARVGDELAARDEADAARAAAPLRPAADAIHIDTDRLDAEAVLAEALRIVRERVSAL